MNAAKRLISPLKLDSKKPKLCSESEAVKENLDFLFDEDSDFNLADFAIPEAKSPRVLLDLSEWQRCVVEEVERDQRTFNLILLLSSESKKPSADSTVPASKCHLQGPWAHTHIAVGDVVSVLAKWDEQLDAYKVDKDHGFCVTNPDNLISGTTVVGSLFCRRKAVLQDRFRGVDANSKVMVIGTLVHELLQIVLTKRLKTYDEIKRVTEDMLRSQETAFTLYGSSLNREETEIEVQKFVPNVVSFVKQYVEGGEPTVILKDNFQGRIADIQDIEENLWVPQLGLKGKVDVSVKIHRRRSNLKFEPVCNTAIPLELKTGRATMSMEHKGQVLLYQMMLSAMGRETNSGLLLYLREGIMREIRNGRNEQRDLIVLRNDISHYLSQLPTLPPAEATAISCGEGKFLQPMELPEPISHHSACNTCAYATICCSFVKTDPALTLRDSHPLRKVLAEVTAHLKPRDYEYFIRWCGLLALEEQEAKKANLSRTLWTEAPEIRQSNGRAVLGLKLDGAATIDESRYLQTFKLQSADDGSLEKPKGADLTLSGFSVGEYVIVSSSRRLAIAAGSIYALTRDSISISLERNLYKNYASESFIVDKHESQSGNVFNFTNLGLMLEDNERAAAMRAIIVEQQQPTYHKVLPKIVATSGTSILQELNAIQRSAVLKALTTQSFMLIKGLPGTGKTQTLIAIVRLLHLMGKSVLITSHTHSAVDNLLLRLLKYDLAMLRLGSGARINPLLQPHSEGELMKDCHTEESLGAKYAAYNIVGVTCLGAGHSIFLHRKFDYCIVDEATQVMQPTVLRPLFYCKKFILVGDPDQLPPLIRSKEARMRDADESLFLRLDTAEATSVLTLQYRMNKTITKIANDLTYSGALQCASDQVKMATMSVEIPPAVFVEEKWLQRTLLLHIDMAVFLVDTMDCSERSSAFASANHSGTCAAIEQSFAEQLPIKSGLRNDNVLPLSPAKQKSTSKRRLSKYTNYCDAAVIFHIVKTLLSAGYDPDRIGIIAPYRAQVELLRKLAEQHHAYYAAKQPTPALDFARVEVNTVDQYQGRDKDIILYSCAKTGSVTASSMERSREAEILEDKRRLTVAVTRAKMKLLLIGDAACMQQYSPFRTLLARIPSVCKLQLCDGKLGFSWKALLNELRDVIASGK